MSSKPILFSGPMVRAILEGRKSQTRRVVKPQPNPEYWQEIVPGWYSPTVIRNGLEEPGPEVYGFASEDEGWRCPYGAPGDSLWVRETWKPYFHLNENGSVKDEGIYYKATGSRRMMDLEPGTWSMRKADKWRPSIHMPRWASRISLSVKDVRVERVQDITYDAVVAEGVWDMMWAVDFTKSMKYPTWKSEWVRTWDALNAKRGYSWESNPWVWVVEFERQEAQQ